MQAVATPPSIPVTPACPFQGGAGATQHVELQRDDELLLRRHRRMLAQYGSAASLDLTEAQPGTVATLRLPLEKTPA